MADASLSLGIDAREGVSGARDYVRAAESTVGASKKAEEGAQKVGASLHDTAKQFGFAKRDLNEFFKVGASVFTGDILAKTLGFSNVIGLVAAGTDLAATGIKNAAIALRDHFHPEIKAAQGRAEDFRRTLEDIAKLKAERIGPTEPFAGSEIRLAGLSGLRLEQVKETINASRKVLDEINQQEARALRSVSNQRAQFLNLNGPSSEELDRRASAAKEEAAAARELQLRNLNAYVETQKIGATLDEKAVKDADRRLAAEEKITAEREKQIRSFHFLNQGTQESQATGRFLLGGASQVARLSESAAIAVRNQINARAEDRQAAPAVAATIISRSIMSAFSASASTIAAVLTSGKSDEAIATQARDVSDRRGFDQSEAIKKQREETDKIVASERERLELAQQVFNLDIGNRLAQGFEDAVLSGNKLRDVLKGLLLDLERMVFQRTITKPLGEWIGGFLPGGTGANSNPYVPGPGGGVGPVVPGGGASPILPLAASGGINSLDGGFRFSRSQRSQGRTRSFV